MMEQSGEPLVYTVSQAAKKLGRSRDKIYELIYSNQLKVKRDNGRYLIPRTELEEYANKADYYSEIA